MSKAWLMDKSALVRIPKSPDRELWLRRITSGLVRVTTVTLLELGFSTRSGSTWAQEMLNPPISELPVENLSAQAEKRAVEVQGMLAQRGYHRAAGVADLLIAATAELDNLTVLHLDRDFELIAGVTGQAHERLRGDF